MPHMEQQLSLQAFWDAVEQRLAACSAEELRAIVRALAQATPATERQAFLERMPPMAEAGAVVPPEPLPEALLADIAALADELQAATAEAEGWDEYHEEDSLGPYAEFVEPLTALFDRATAAFDAGNVTLVRTAYQHLFETLSYEDDYGRGVRAENLQDVALSEAGARYLRAVYDTESPAHRPAVLFETMLQVRSWLSTPHPMLDDLIQISPQPLPDQEQFCLDWLAFLRTQNSSEADAWLREAVRLSQGTAGLETLARTEGVQRPRAYLDWCAALTAEGKHHAILAAAREALRALPRPLPIRAAVADYLCAAALHLHDTTALRAGRWEAFVAKPTLARLLDVWEVTPAGADRIGRMSQAAQHVQHALSNPPPQVTHAWVDAIETPVWPDKSVLAHAYLLAGDWDAAYRLAAPEQVLGWSSSHNTQGLVVSCCLVQMSGAVPGRLPPNLTQLWHWELQNSTGLVSWYGADAGEASLLIRLQHAYTECLPEIALTSDQQAELLTWCLDVAQRRIDAIVSNQHRGSYDKAALLLASCTELLRLLGKAQEARALLDEVRQQFRRHRAFQAELQTAVRRMGA
jgi:tetratricopeptide (TPR) repeat protein